MKRLLNPVAHFDEKNLLIIGLLSIAVNLVIGHFFQLKMVSILKFVDANDGFRIHLFYVVRAYTAAILALYFYGFLINRKTRFLDIANTVLLAIIPFMLVSPLIKVPVVESTFKRILENPQLVTSSDMTLIMVFCLVMIPFLVYKIVLLFNGFKTATHMKAWYHVVLFFVLLLAIATYTPHLFR